MGINGPTKIIAIQFVRRGTYWDFHVPVYENYLLEGVWHHNSGTTTCGLAKAVEFMTFQQPPPRRDTPFWIIAANYPQVMGTCWKEKLHQKGLIHPNYVDWDRIQYYRPNMDWPYSVPLKPKKNHPGRNWLIQFKSYEQGRAAMQAEAIGGFLFVEQFPWGLLEEVMRGTREYSFFGNKLCEFTPVDPSLSIELRDMEENGKLPESWGLYRASTRCAMEAGHVSADWFRDFFGMVPDSMQKVREAGLWGNFEGSVYPEFNPLIHCTPKGWEIPANWHHRRAIDFGFSIEHPFACVFECHDDRGRSVIYDEYWSNDTTMSVIDHYMAIADMYHWPSQIMNPRYGVTWVDHDLDAVRTLQKVDEYVPGYHAPNMQLAIKNVNEGIEHVKYMLKQTIQVEPGVFEPRLKIVKENCPHLMKEMISYRRPKQMATGPNAQSVKQDPVKKDDDTVDAMRYLLFSEASSKGITPSTMARQHSATPGMNIDSPKFKQPRQRRERKSDKLKR